MKYFNILFLILFLTTSAKAQSVKVSVSKVSIPTYTEPEREELPMFAENRVHQRSSGNPYPNKIVLKVNREQKVDKEYTLIKLENEYLELQILPEIGGKIYAAKDKTIGYDFFYKNHVIKPALIGALGSWISGGPVSYTHLDVYKRQQQESVIFIYSGRAKPEIRNLKSGFMIYSVWMVHLIVNKKLIL